jgi:hypothetical protein
MPCTAMACATTWGRGSERRGRCARRRSPTGPGTPAGSGRPGPHPRERRPARRRPSPARRRGGSPAARGEPRGGVSRLRCPPPAAQHRDLPGTAASETPGGDLRRVRAVGVHHDDRPFPHFNSAIRTLAGRCCPLPLYPRPFRALFRAADWGFLRAWWACFRRCSRLRGGGVAEAGSAGFPGRGSPGFGACCWVTTAGSGGCGPACAAGIPRQPRHFTRGDKA